MDSIEQIVENFSFLDDWDDRYRYLIELGHALEPLPDDQRTDANKVQGCVSQVWLWATSGNDDDPKIAFVGDSDAHLVRGLVAIALAMFSDQPASRILELDADAVFSEIGLKEHLTRQRSNGLRSLVARIKRHAGNSLTMADQL